MKAPFQFKLFTEIDSKEIIFITNLLIACGFNSHPELPIERVEI